MVPRSRVLVESPGMGRINPTMLIPAVRLVVITACCTAWAVGGKFSFERELMGTRFSIVCYTKDRATAETSAEAAFEIAERINQVASDYLPKSELSRLSCRPVSEAVEVSPMLYDLFEHSLTIAKSTDGAFDPTLAPFSRIWRECRKSGKLPAPETIESARNSVGWQHVVLDSVNRSIRMKREGMSFDLGGVAKGHAADSMIESFFAAGLKQVMIVAGGDVRLGEAPPGRAGWNVAVKTFHPDRSDEILTLSHAAVSTSGDLYQSVEIDGVSYSHIIDPKTGLGLTHRIAATVIADHARLSDPLATAACVMGEHSAERLKNIRGVREVRIRTLQDPADPARLKLPAQPAHEK